MFKTFTLKKQNKIFNLLLSSYIGLIPSIFKLCDSLRYY